MKRLTVSSAKCFRRCARQFKIRYLLGYRTLETPEALRVGTLTHTGLECIWNGQPVDLGDSEVDPFDRAKVEALLFGYVARWGMPTDVVRVEAEFCAPLTNPETGKDSRTWVLAGKIDAITRRQIIEHKTSSEDIELGSDYWKRLRMDAQVSTYLVGAKSLGFDPEGCMYDVIRKPALKPRKATPVDKRKYKKLKKGEAGPPQLHANQREHDETPEAYGLRIREELASNPEKYYQRGTVVRLSDEARDAAHDLWQTGKLIRDSELTDRWPRNPDACLQWGRACAYFPICTSEASLDDPALYQKLENVHTELTLQPGDPHDTNEPECRPAGTD